MLPRSVKSPSSIRSFVLRSGRETAAQRRAYDSYAERFIVPFEDKVMDFQLVFGNNAPVIAEIGFGMGEATAILAAANPAINYVGIEVHKPGIGRLLWEIEQRSLANIRIVEYDAVEVFAKMIPPRSLEGIHLFFPDPWPKKRHHKRRLVTRPFTETMAARLAPNGYLYMVTDWEDYAHWALAELGSTNGIVNTCEGFTEPAGFAKPGGFTKPQSWRPRTKFEQKGLAKNHQVRELFFINHG